MTIEELLNELVELGLEKHDPVRKEARSEKRRIKKEQAEKPESKREQATSKELKKKRATQTQDSLPPAEMKRSRYIPVKERPKREPCGFVDEKTGRRCNSTKFLQMDHVKPYSQGGANTADNLRWLCGEHNRERI